MVRWLCGLSVVLAACSASPSANDANGSGDSIDAGGGTDSGVDVRPVTDGGRDVVALDAPDVRDAMDSGPRDTGVDRSDGATCASGVYTRWIVRCLDMGTDGPRSCLAQALAAIDGLPPCDVDGDGMADDLEDAMAQSYSLAFAFNLGNGSHMDGNTEDRWPDNVNDWIGYTTLDWRVDGDSSTLQTVDSQPTLDTIAAATIQFMGVDRFAYDPVTGQGPDFWLCMNRPGGSYPAASQVETLTDSANLPTGVDVINVVHPVQGDPTGQYAFVSSLLFYAYNLFATVDDHEGDWEGGGVLVDMDTGQVVALYTDRHNTSDNARLMPLIGPGAVSAIDPSSETPFGDICSSSDAALAAGVRFWDFYGNQHHAIDYVSAGGHAGYAYPGYTKITGIGCLEATIVRDTHNGGAQKLLPWLGEYVDDWAGNNPHPIVNGMHFQAVGEVTAPRLSWANFRGQWGCQIGTIANSWPGPFGNQRDCRAWLVSNGWNAAPPFTPPTDTCTEHP